MFRSLRSVRICFVLLTAAVLLLPGPVARAAFPGANGKIAFTSERDGNAEIYVVEPDGSAPTNLTQNSASDHDPAWSADGTRIAFTSDRDGNSEIYVMDADGNNPVRLTNDSAVDHDAAWSPDGAKIVFATDRDGSRDLYVMDADGTAQQSLTSGADFDHEPSWSPDGTLIAFTRAGSSGGGSDIYTVQADGTGDDQLTHTSVDEGSPNWAPDGTLLVFAREFTGLVTMRPDGSDQATISNLAYGSPAWSPEGSDIVVADLTDTSDFEITIISEIGTQARRLTENAVNDRRPDWQPVPPAPPIPGYPRPKGASPVRVALVPASEPCAEPNALHGPPLAFPSCAPPQQRSSYLTVGTPDTNGRTARSSGFVRLAVVPDPEAGMDVSLTASLTDVRCGTALPTCTGGVLSDYTGELQLSSPVRITDRLNGHTQDRPGTLDLFAFPVTVPCDATPDPGVGGTCSLDTTLNAVLPGVVRSGKRAIWELGQIEVRDGGADGVASTDDYTVFAVQGVFVP